MWQTSLAECSTAEVSDTYCVPVFSDTHVHTQAPIYTCSIVQMPGILVCIVFWGLCIKYTKIKCLFICMYGCMCMCMYRVWWPNGLSHGLCIWESSKLV